MGSLWHRKGSVEPFDHVITTTSGVVNPLQPFHRAVDDDPTASECTIKRCKLYTWRTRVHMFPMYRYSYACVMRTPDACTGECEEPLNGIVQSHPNPHLTKQSPASTNIRKTCHISPHLFAHSIDNLIIKLSSACSRIVFS